MGEARMVEVEVEESTLRQISDAATPGPWLNPDNGYVESAATGRKIADVRYRNGDADRALIVAAVNYVRVVLAADHSLNADALEEAYFSGMRVGIDNEVDWWDESDETLRRFAREYVANLARFPTSREPVR